MLIFTVYNKNDDTLRYSALPSSCRADRSLTNFYDDLIDDRVCENNDNTVATSVACLAIRGNITHALRLYPYYHRDSNIEGDEKALSWAKAPAVLPRIYVRETWLLRHTRD
jgi:hypothetical protein